MSVDLLMSLVAFGSGAVAATAIGYVLAATIAAGFSRARQFLATALAWAAAATVVTSAAQLRQLLEPGPFDLATLVGNLSTLLSQPLFGWGATTGLIVAAATAIPRLVERIFEGSESGRAAEAGRVKAKL
ncbi:MAG: hypothetical protein QOI38_1049 [Sphingomonadales bacterium]|jgi:hypothetical protein|nr:hypothetical protein [Sphingomonadales bacterium]